MVAVCASSELDALLSLEEPLGEGSSSEVSTSTDCTPSTCKTLRSEDCSWTISVPCCKIIPERVLSGEKDPARISSIID